MCEYKSSSPLPLKIACPWCDGTGRRDELKSRCQEEGTYDPSVPCPHCSGTGEIYSSDLTSEN